MRETFRIQLNLRFVSENDVLHFFIIPRQYLEWQGIRTNIYTARNSQILADFIKSYGQTYTFKFHTT